MKVFEGKTITQVYGKLVEALFDASHIDNTREIQNCMLVIENPTLDKIRFPYRSISMTYAIEELKWYWSADNSCKTIGKHAKMWLAISDDGETSNSAYGYIIQKKYDKNQLEEVIEVLRQDNNSRKAVLNISDASIDRLKTKDMQCTIALQFLIRDDKLHMTVYMRSNDVYFGLPYDYIFFVSIQQYIAKRLNIEVGSYIHHATSMHMYDRDYDKFNAANSCQEISINAMIIINSHYKGAHYEN